MDVVVMDACQQATCSFAQRLPLLNVLAVVLFGIPVFAVLIHFALRSWRSARLDLRERRQVRSVAVGAKGTAQATVAVSGVTVASAYARMLWSLGVAALALDWVYFSAYNIKRLATSQPSDLRFPSGSIALLVVVCVVWAVTLLALAVLWKLRPREALPPMLKRAE